MKLTLQAALQGAVICLTTSLLTGCFDTHVYMTKSLCQSSLNGAQNQILGEFAIAPQKKANLEEFKATETADYLKISKNGNGQIKLLFSGEHFDKIKTLDLKKGCESRGGMLGGLSCELDLAVQGFMREIEKQNLRACTNPAINGVLLEYKDPRGSGGFSYLNIAKDQTGLLSLTLMTPNMQRLQQEKPDLMVYDPKIQNGGKHLYRFDWNKITGIKDLFEEIKRSDVTLLFDNSKGDTATLIKDYFEADGRRNEKIEIFLRKLAAGEEKKKVGAGPREPVK